MQTSSLWTSKAAGHGGLAAAVVDHIMPMGCCDLFLEFAVVSSAFSWSSLS